LLLLLLLLLLLHGLQEEMLRTMCAGTKGAVAS
jgi:hypothetical protein